jgi:hypothetical protein
MDWQPDGFPGVRDYSRKRRDSRDMSWYFAAHTYQPGDLRFQLNARGGCYHGQRRRCREFFRQHAPAVYEGPPGESSFVFFKNQCGRCARRASQQRERRGASEQRAADRA